MRIVEMPGSDGVCNVQKNGGPREGVNSDGPAAD